MILTDSSQGGYRRLAIVDDRLVGYLSVGTTQPDSLAIKHIIDEGHPVRDVLNTLLKGNLDARRYLSQQKSHAVKKWITGQLFVPGRELNSTTQIPGPPETDPGVPVLPTSQTNALPVSTSEQAIRPLEEQPNTVSTMQGHLKEQSFIYEEEPSPFTGNLPVVFGQKRDIDGCLFLKESAKNVSEEVEPFIEDSGPFSGNLPTATDRVIESQKQPAKDQKTVRPTRRLLTYIENGA
jgi:hypothetical protein